MSEPHQSGDELDDYKEQDRFLPIANVARIMKKALPDNAKIAKEAKETVQECVSEFISFITSEGMAHFRCLSSSTPSSHMLLSRTLARDRGHGSWWRKQTGLSLTAVSSHPNLCLLSFFPS